MARPRGWTEEEINDIARQRAEGIPATVMAKQYGVSVEAIYCVAKRNAMTKIPRGASLSPHRREWVVEVMRKISDSGLDAMPRMRHGMSAEDATKARRLWDDGVPASAIGAAIGRTKNSILGHAHRNSWPSRPPAVISSVAYTEDEDTIIRDAVDRKLNDEQIALLLPHRSAFSIQGRRKRIGLTIDRETLSHMAREAAAVRNAMAKAERDARRKAKEKPFVPRVILHCDPIPFTHEHRGCQWLTSDARPWMVCSNARVPGLSYCAGHYHLSIRPSKPPTEPEEAPAPVMEMAA